jgi:hypothetical protein
MGRHSAPDDEEDGDVLLEAPVEDRPTPRGRHARPDEAEVPEQPPGQPPEQPAAQVGKGDQPTAADLELLRSRPDVRNRVIAAVVAPFVIYTIVIVLIGSLGSYVLWVWLPLVTAGVLAGSILDAAHRKGRSAATPPESRDDEAGG